VAYPSRLAEDGEHLRMTEALYEVYRVPDGDLELYVKFTSDLIAEFKLLSFKER
jgi:hypothetical protein